MKPIWPSKASCFNHPENNGIRCRMCANCKAQNNMRTACIAAYEQSQGKAPEDWEKKYRDEFCKAYSSLHGSYIDLVIWHIDFIKKHVIGEKV